MSTPPLVRLHKSAPAIFIALGLLALQLSTAPAQSSERAISEPTATAPAVGAETSPSIYDRIWQLPTLYQDKQSNFLNELRFIGRLHLDVYNLDSNLGADRDWNVRRLRLGGKARLFQRLEAQLEVDLNVQDDGSAYKGLTNAYLAWKWSDAVKLTAGKHSVRFTLDGSTSANELLTIDRNNLSNNLWFTDDQIPGVSLSGKVGQWIYNTGLYSGGTRSREFGDFDAGNFWLGSAGYDFGKQLGVKQALLRADYVFNDVDAKSTFTRPFEQIGSMVFLLELERWGVSADVTAGRGTLGQSDVVGAVAMPWFSVTKKLQVVGRYTFVTSDEANGVRLARYENTQTTGRGDRYQEAYAGLNYFVYGHKLKLQTGLAYTRMRDRAADGGGYNGWSWTSGFRVSW